MKIIDRYIIKELLLPFLSGILAFTTILLGSTVLFALVSDAVKYGIPFRDIALLVILKLPYVVALAIPMSTLFATITVFSRLGNDLELLALRANGVSVIRLLVPVIFVGILISFLSVWFGELVVPASAKAAKTVMYSYKYKNVPRIQKNINLTEYKDGFPYRIINIGEKDQQAVKNITIAEYNRGDLVRLIRANHGNWINSGAWEFFDGIMHFFKKDSLKEVTVIEFEKEFINLNLKPLDLGNRNRSVEEMTRKEMKDWIALKERTGHDPIKLIMDMHMKTAVAFSSFIYCFLGASMGLKPHRSSSAMGIGLSLVIIFAYILLMAIGSGLGMSKAVPAVFAAWFPNIVVGIISVVLVRKLASS